MALYVLSSYLFVAVVDKSKEGVSVWLFSMVKIINQIFNFDRVTKLNLNVVGIFLFIAITINNADFLLNERGRFCAELLLNVWPKLVENVKVQIHEKCLLELSNTRMKIYEWFVATYIHEVKGCGLTGKMIKLRNVSN